ncbi:MAG: oligoribonuclease [Cardiobacteriaceae bacterium]|nr:oligoribonuclease [Cardiobacteriaceae bacterium]
MRSEENLVWIDLEMTGLNPEEDRILEMAAIVSDKDLNIIAESEVFIINQDKKILENMNEWCKNQHGKNGLIEKVLASKLDEKSAENQMLEFLQKYCYKNKSPLCGNSIWQDRRFLCKYMPELESFFHYRNIDVSSVKELAKRWYPEAKQYKKNNNHRALDDIRESIQELDFYRKELFKK